MAYYILIFDQAWEIMLKRFKIGADSAENEKRSMMVFETNTKYINESKEDEEIGIMVAFFDYDKKYCI
jgi:acyl-CoA thioester hydrolase